MAGVDAGRAVKLALALLLLIASAPQPASALEAFDGRIQLHGFYEMQVRGLNSDFAEEIDLAQWYHVINLELEFDILPDGWGPFDLLQAYVRAEGRYDCIYTSGCGMFPSVNTYGNDSQDLPLRLRDAVDDSWAGTIPVNDKEVPPGKIPLVPTSGPLARDPVPWGILVLTSTPLGDKGATNPPLGNARDQDPCIAPDDIGSVPCTRFADPAFRTDDQTDRTNSPNYFDPSIDQPFKTGAGPDGNLRSYLNLCSVNYLPNPDDQRRTCIDNRPERFEVAKRQGFPGFDTLFDQQGADRELGENVDYATVANLRLQNPDAPLITDPDFPNQELDAVTSDRYWDPDGEIPDGAVVFAEFTRNLRTASPPDTRSDQDLFRDALYGPLFRGVARLRDDPAFYSFENVFDWRFTFRSTPGGDGGGGQILPMGPWLPKNFFTASGVLADRGNPFRGRRTPTYIFSEFVLDPLTPERDGPDDPPIMNQASRRLGGIRYHDLDEGTDDEFGNLVNCTGPDAKDCDPIDPRILRVEALTQSLGQSRLEAPPGGSPDLFDRNDPDFVKYPNNPFLEDRRGGRFGGDFTGIIPCFPTQNALRQSAGDFQRFDRQILGYEFNQGCIPYTNIQVTGGEGELPFRAAPGRSNLEGLDLATAQGIFFPSAGFVRSLGELDYDDHEFNISQIDRSFNRGASQSDTYELKEAYADLEFFDSRLWIRAGLQNIVWGKTELFRTTDQFNPQDLALASLPSLEESRIGLLSARAVWSFYDVGPLEDVRFEAAVNFDRFKPADLGGCGEPYTIDLVCGLTLGTAIHGVTGIGVTGFDRPPAGYEDIDGVEFGGRIEFRWDRFSFAITDFYGYNDFPYPEPVFFYDRTVDFSTGRPIKALAGKGGCTNGAGILVQNPFRNRAADVNGDGAFNQDVTKLLHPGTPGQYDQNDPDRVQYRTVGERSLQPTELYALGNPDYDSGPPATNSPVRFTDPNEELARVGAEDDYWRRLEASTILGAGIDPDCLKPGGPAGGPNENRFDDRKYAAIGDFDRYSNSDTDEVTNLLGDSADGVIDGDSDTFQNATYGQWQRVGHSVDPSLAYHPANQQLFHFTCIATVGIATALSPSACAWNLFGTSVGFLAGEGVGFVETVSEIYAGEPSFPGVHSPINGVVGATKSGSGGLIGTSSPLVSLNSDIRDGRTDAMGAGNNSGGERIADWFTSPPNANEFAPRSNSTDAPMSNGRLPYDDCPGESRASFTDPSVVQGTCLKKTARDPWDYLGLGNTLTMEQKALLGCGPYFGTRCGSGERVVAVYYQRDKLDSIGNKITVGTLPYPPGDTTPDTGATVYGPENTSPDVQVVSIAAGTYDVGGVLVELQDSGILGGSNPLARPVKVAAIGKLNPVASDFCELDELDECTVFAEGGGVDFLNMEGSALIQAFPGVEGTTLGGGWIDPNNPGNLNPLPGARTWVPGEAGDSRTYSLDPQPGTTGIPGLKAAGERVEEPIRFEGGGVCTRYDPGNPLADASGLVKLPGCRGAQEIVINDDLQTVDVVFERGYTPRQDGCMIQRAMRLATSKPGVGGRSFYYVRPVIKDEFDLQNNQLLDVDLANELAETCWNGGAYANVIGADLQILPFMFDGDGNVVANPDNVWRSSDPSNPTTTKIDPRSLQPTQFYVDKTEYQIYYDVEGNETGRDVGNETIRNPKQYDPTFFSYTRRQIYCPRGDKNGIGIGCRLADIQTPSGVGGNPNWTALPTAALYRIRNSRNGGAFVRDDRPNGPARDPALSSPFPTTGATNINELFQLSQGLNANGTINNKTFTSARVDDIRYFGTGQSIIGAGTLFHPFAMCQNATFRIPEGQGLGTGAGRQRWQDPDSDDYNQGDPLVCNYRVRDYENDLLNQNAQIFQNELAAMSWNFMQFLIIASCNDKSGNDNLADADCFDPKNPWGTDRCSYSTPHLCRNVKGFLAVNGVGRNDVRAGGNARFGRRSFIWDSGAEVALRYARRNVFGFSADFAEDVTKTNWGMEFTYIGQIPFIDNGSMTNISDSGAVNLTVSIDRPTFINFLNANRTFFMNTQWFFQYLPGYEKDFTSPGPFNTLFTFAIFTGYYQDRLLPQFVSVYDFRSKSGGFLPQLSYRFTEAFSMTFGISWFIGKDNYVSMPVNGIAPVTNRAGRRAYQNGNEQLLNLIKRRDEAFLRLRWTF